MNDTFQVVIDASRRLWALRFIERCSGSAPASLLLDLMDRVGLVMTRDEMIDVIDWLVRSELARRHDFEGEIVVTLRERGDEFLSRRRQVEGIARPPLED